MEFRADSGYCFQLFRPGEPLPASATSGESITAASLGTTITSSFSYLLDETFTNVHGIYLDRGASLFETLATITAEEASVRFSERCAPIAGQVEYVRFYIEILERDIRGEKVEGVDCDASWWLTKVTAEE